MSKQITATPELPQSDNIAAIQIPEQPTLTEQAIAINCPNDCGYFDKDGERAYHPIKSAKKEDSGLYDLNEYGSGWKLLFSHQAPKKAK